MRGACRSVTLALAVVACGRDVSREAGAGDIADAPPSVSRDRGTASCTVLPRVEWTPANVGAATFVVNRATRGMAARVRWAIAPDSSAMIVVEDPAGVENEAIPDGVLFASEGTGRTWRMDSVWSASPSPDWSRVAVGRAVMLGGGEQQVVAPSRWRDAARSLSSIAGVQAAITAESLRAHSYPVSGMAVAEGAAATFVADVARDTSEAPLHFVALDGWRVRWSCDGHDVVIGERPERVQDDAPAKTSRRVAAVGGTVTGAPVADSVPWVPGPTLDISVPIARDARTLRTRDREIVGRSGRIAVRDSLAGGWSPLHDIGAGVPLAATRHGRFVLAIAPRSDARPHESPDQAVVYRVPRLIR